MSHAVAPAVASPVVRTVQAVAQPVAVVQQPTLVAQQVTPIEYKQVALPPKQVQVPVTRTHVEVPIHQKVHYGVQQYVAGHSTQIHKPSLSAPAIQPPAVFKQKVTHNAPEVTIKHHDYPIVKSTPEFVEKPFHAGEIVEYTEPHIQEVKVPTPYKVPVAQPVVVQKHVPFVTKETVAVDVAPAVQTVAVQPAVQAVAVQPALKAVQGVAVQGVAVQPALNAVHGVAVQGVAVQPTLNAVQGVATVQGVAVQPTLNAVHGVAVQPAINTVAVQPALNAVQGLAIQPTLNAVPALSGTHIVAKELNAAAEPAVESA